MPRLYLKICLHQLQRTATVMNFQIWQWEMSLCFAWMWLWHQTPHSELAKCDKRQSEGQWPSPGYASVPQLGKPTDQVTVNTEWVKEILPWKFFPWIQKCHMIHQWLGRITPLSLKLILGYHDDILKGKKKWHRRNYFSVKKKKLLGQILETIFSSDWESQTHLKVIPKL